MRLTLGLTLVFLVASGSPTSLSTSPAWAFAPARSSLLQRLRAGVPAGALHGVDAGDDPHAPADDGHGAAVPHPSRDLRALRRRRKIALIVAAFVSAALEEGGGWLVRFLDPGFAAVKIVGFLGLQSAIGFLLASLAVFLWKSAGAPAPAAGALERRKPLRAGGLRGEAATLSAPAAREP